MLITVGVLLIVAAATYPDHPKIAISMTPFAMNLQPDDFAAQVADAYLHIYDIVYLRTHPLAEIVTPQPDVRAKRKAWQLHDVLLALIEELDPGEQAPADGREMRRFRLLAMRYGEGLSSKAVADALAISLRHYYREHDTAIEAVSKILWARYGGNFGAGTATITQDMPGATGGADGPEESPLTQRQALLRAEVAHVQDFGQETRLGDLLAGVLQLAQELTRAKGLHLRVEPYGESPLLPIDRRLVRQILLGLLSYLSEQLEQGELQVRVQAETDAQVIEIEAVGVQRPAAAIHQRAEQIATLRELAGLQAVELAPLLPAANRQPRVGFRLRLPCMARRSVLLIDDNVDILELYQRYLQQGYHHAIAAQNGTDALRLARQLRPQVIVLDLMLPEQDGWEILQQLSNHPDTADIPIVICSILRARQLALALGAAAFLEKPVDEEEFLRVIETLAAQQPARDSLT